MVAGHGGDRKSENIKSNNITLDSDLFTEPESDSDKPKRGTSRAYTLTRLNKERPDHSGNSRQKMTGLIVMVLYRPWHPKKPSNSVTAQRTGRGILVGSTYHTAALAAPSRFDRPQRTCAKRRPTLV